MNPYLVEKLRTGRMNKKLKQNEVAKMIGVKGNTLSNYENGISEPDIDTFCKLCMIYELNPSEVFGEAYGFQTKEIKIDHIKPSEIEHLESYRMLDSHGKEMVDLILQNELIRSITYTDQQEQLSALQKRLSAYQNLHTEK